MRSFSLLQEAIIPYIPTLITQLTQKLLAVSKVTANFESEVSLTKLFGPWNPLALGKVLEESVCSDLQLECFLGSVGMLAGGDAAVTFKCSLRSLNTYMFLFSSQK
jgi:hypothetical protein